MPKLYSLSGKGRAIVAGTVTHQGKMLRLDLPETKDKPMKREIAKRGLAAFSGPSRRRLLQTLAKVSRDALPVFLTLTYGREWPREPRAWKRHLHVFLLRMTSHGFAGVWKLEPQRRGAPHFHLLVWGGRVPKEWLSRAWAECSEDTSPDHLRAGTRVESIRSSNGTMYYCAKYVGKVDRFDEIQDFPEWHRAGRWWGVFNKAAVPWAEAVSRPLSAPAVRVVQCVIDSIHTTRNKGKSLPEYIRPTTAFIEPEDFRVAVEHQARKYARAVASSLGRSEQSIAGGLVAEIFLDSGELVA